MTGKFYRRINRIRMSNGWHMLCGLVVMAALFFAVILLVSGIQGTHCLP